MQIPERKQSIKDLSEVQKQQYKQKASVSVKVEHTIGKVKIYRILKDRIRLWKQGIKDLVMALGCALHNFKLHYKT